MSERKGILVVDDSLAALKLLTDILMGEGYAVRPASSGEQAKASVLAELPELVLLDVRMPVMDGFEVCGWLKEQPACRDIPVLFLSASADAEERIKGFEKGAVDFISKPFQRNELLARVRTHLELSRLQTRLETMVELRTEELKISNEHLQLELAERKKAEEELKLRNIILSTQQEASIDAILVVDNAGKILSYNTNFTKLWGIPDEIMESGSDELALKSVLKKLAHPENFIKKVIYLYERPCETSSDEIDFLDGRIIERYSAPMNGSDGKNYGRVWYFRDITGRRRAEMALNYEKKFTDALLESVPGLLYMYNENGYLVKWNKKHEYITGYSPDELKKIHFLDWFDEFDKDKTSDGLSKMFRNGYVNYEVNLKIKAGADIPFLLTAVPLEIENKKYFVGIGIDITKIREAEERLKHSLGEKEILIKELYHRTKNNMQVICSMLKLHSHYNNGEKAANNFREIENRIYTMALVHQKLFQSKNLSLIYFHDFVHELCDLLVKSYNTPENKIAFKLDIAEIPVLIDIAVPCGLLLNELITNSIKFAFPGDAKGDISIKICRAENDSIDIFYGDNGVGAPAGFDFEKDGKMGIQTVYSIGRHQLQGKADFKSENGLKCHISFHEKHYSQRI